METLNLLPTINGHIKKIYADGELTEEATIRKFRIVQEEGGAKSQTRTNTLQFAVNHCSRI